MMKRFALIAAVPALLAACATPPGAMQESDFNWSETTVAATPAQVFRGVMAHARRCGTFGNALAEGQYYPDLDEQQIDLFITSGFVTASNSGIVAGSIRIKALPDGSTSIRAGVPPKFDRSGKRPAFYAGLVADPSKACDYEG
jgi:hypothetical protein